AVNRGPTKYNRIHTKKDPAPTKTSPTLKLWTCFKTAKSNSYEDNFVTFSTDIPNQLGSWEINIIAAPDEIHPVNTGYDMNSIKNPIFIKLIARKKRPLKNAIRLTTVGEPYELYLDATTPPSNVGPMLTSLEVPNRKFTNPPNKDEHGGENAPNFWHRRCIRL
ncbi:hypothetical protein HZS_4471, partial [Henneguya salminicola]